MTAIPIKELMNGVVILAGSAEGVRLLARIVEAVIEPATPTALYLDFDGIEVATASFLRDGPLAYKRMMRARGSTIYPFIANANSRIEEDLRLLLENQNDAVLLCQLDSAGKPSGTRLLGRLDEKQLLAFNIVQNEKTVDVSSISRKSNEQIGPTAWNNRLSALVQKGVVIELARGRAKQFLAIP